MDEGRIARLQADVERAANELRDARNALNAALLEGAPVRVGEFVESGSNYTVRYQVSRVRPNGYGKGNDAFRLHGRRVLKSGAISSNETEMWRPWRKVEGE